MNIIRGNYGKRNEWPQVHILSWGKANFDRNLQKLIGRDGLQVNALAHEPLFEGRLGEFMEYSS